MCWLPGFKWQPAFYVVVMEVYVVDKKGYVLITCINQSNMGIYKQVKRIIFI